MSRRKQGVPVCVAPRIRGTTDPFNQLLASMRKQLSLVTLLTATSLTACDQQPQMTAGQLEAERRYAEEATRQNDEFNRQQEETAKQLERSAEQLDRADTLLVRQEAQMDRFDAILSKWESSAKGDAR